MQFCLKTLITLLVFLSATALHAEALQADEKAAQYSAQYSSVPSPSVADNIAAMDKDHDGIVTVHEMREFIESKHGKGYQKKLFDEMEKSAENRSCGSSFSKSLY